MVTHNLPGIGEYAIGVHDGTLVDAIVHSDTTAMAEGFSGRSLDEPLFLGVVSVTPVGAAIASGSPGALRWLVNRGAKLDTDHVSAFLEASRYGDPTLLRELAEDGADIHADRGFGGAFIRALYGDRNENLPTIHQLGHDAVTYGGAALRKAVSDKNREAVDFLVSHGADTNFSGTTSVFPNRETPLHIAVRTGDLDLVRLLMDAGADPERTNRLGNRAYDDAAQAGRLEIASYLRSFEPADRRTREAILGTPAAQGLPIELIAFLEGDDRTLLAAPDHLPGWMDFLALTDTVPIRVGRTRTVLRISREIDGYLGIWVVWSPRLARIGALVLDDTLEFYRLGTWDQFRSDPFAAIGRILSGEARPTSA